MSASSKPAVGETLPWAPLYSVTRASTTGVGQPEVTLYGVAFVWAEDLAAKNNSGLALLRVGETRMPLWSRSLLKPFQLLVLYPTLKQTYPALNRAHFAMLMASHQGDAPQLALLQEILALGQLTEADLQCSACTCMRANNPQTENRLHHPCSGKHLAHLLYLKARNLPLSAYLQPDQEPYLLLRELLCYLLYVDKLPESVDGCGMPNFGLSAVELAQLYHALVLPVSRDMIRQCPDELTEILTHWNDIAALMQELPELIGGTGRLDTRLMQEQNPGPGPAQVKLGEIRPDEIRPEEVGPAPVPPLIAKEGADGLLCLGIGPTERYAGGLGILIKLASGYSASHLTVIIRQILQELGLNRAQSAEVSPASLPNDTATITQTVFHFTLQGVTQEA